jgi:hypothetical protein
MELMRLLKIGHLEACCQHRLTKPCGFQRLGKRSGTRAAALPADRDAHRKPARLVAATFGCNGQKPHFETY